MLTSWKKLLLSLVLILGFTSGVYAVGTPVTSNPYIPHVFVAGYTGSGTVGTGDVLAPIWLTNDRNFFFYGQGRYGYADEDWADNPWAGSAGFGYRQIGNAAVYGFFVLGDYNHTLTNHNVWQVSPGLEILGRAWEFRANGYIPIGDKNWETQGWADEFGNYDYVTFNGHNQFDAWFIYHEEIGGGADAEIGRTLFKVKKVLVRGLVNGYYFRMIHNKSLRGGGASIEVEPNTYLKFSVDGSYDNYAHTQVAVGVQVSLYDLFSSDSKVLDDQDLQRRLFEPVQRNFANIASANDVSTTGAPQVVQFMGHNAPERSNVWFFSPTATGGDGTYESPYSGSLTQGDVDGIANYTKGNGFATAYLYFTSGIYSAFNSVSMPRLFGDASSGAINFSGSVGQWFIQGRMGDDKGYQKPAQGADRPTIKGSFAFNESDVEIANIKLEKPTSQEAPSDQHDTGIGVQDSNDVVLDEADVTGFETGMNVKDVAKLTFTNTNIQSENSALGVTAGVSTAPADAVGLEVEDVDEIVIDNSTIEADSVNGDGIGIDIIGTDTDTDMDGDGNVDVNVDSIEGVDNAVIEGKSDTKNGYGVNVDTSAVAAGIPVEIKIGSISGVKLEGDGANTGVGFNAVISTAVNGSITIGSIENDTFSGTADVASGTADGLNLIARNNVGTADAIKIGDIKNSTFQASGLNAAGLYVTTQGPGPATAVGNISIGNISNSKFLANPVTASSATPKVGSGIAYGFYALTENNITIGSLTGNVFNGGGVGPSTGFYALTSAGSGILSIATAAGQITGDTFSGSTAAMDLYGAQVLVQTGTFNNGTMLKAFLNTVVNNNTFPVGSGKVCVNTICSP